MPSQQKVLVLTSKQGPFDIATIDVPTPAAGQLLIKVESTALNPIDWKIQVYGLFFETFPAILGLDAAGTVEAVGEGVTNFAKGDRVYVPRDLMYPRRCAHRCSRQCIPGYFHQ